MKLSEEIESALASGDSATKIGLRRRLREDWLPRIVALEALLDAKRNDHQGWTDTPCDSCGLYTGDPCERDDCPINSD